MLNTSHAQPTAAGSIGGMIGSLISQFARKVNTSAHACGSDPPHAATFGHAQPGAHSIGQQQPHQPTSNMNVKDTSSSPRAASQRQDQSARHAQDKSASPSPASHRPQASHPRKHSIDQEDQSAGLPAVSHPPNPYHANASIAQQSGLVSQDRLLEQMEPWA